MLAGSLEKKSTMGQQRNNILRLAKNWKQLISFCRNLWITLWRSLMAEQQDYIFITVCSQKRKKPTQIRNVFLYRCVSFINCCIMLFAARAYKQTHNFSLVFEGIAPVGSSGNQRASFCCYKAFASFHHFILSPFIWYTVYYFNPFVCHYSR